MTPDKLKERWFSLLPGVDPDVLEMGFAELVECYSESHRRYHTLAHVNACLHLLDSVRDKLDDSFSVELALWFHDVIYDPTSSDNEAQSAIFAENVLTRFGISQQTVARVCDLIMVTRHPSTPLTHDAEFMVDIDLAVLGSSREVYAQYAEAIRKEYAHIPDERYKKGRSAVLESFLGQASIYHTAYFNDKLEHIARENLLDEKRRLERR